MHGIMAYWCILFRMKMNLDKNSLAKVQEEKNRRIDP